MWNFLFVVDVIKMLYILEDDGIIFVVDFAQQSLESVSCFEFDGNFVLKKVHDFFDTHFQF